MINQKATRRRGTALEEAILDSAWSVLSAQGYVGLTLEGVAQQAGTSRPVLARRWPTRKHLATAALARHLTLHPIAVNDMGSVREELIHLLRRMAERGQPSVVRLLYDMREDLRDAHESIADLRARVAEVGVREAIMSRAIARGEIDPSRLSPRIAALPEDLARHEILTAFVPLSEDVIVEIVDDIFLPLVAPGRS